MTQEIQTAAVATEAMAKMKPTRAPRNSRSFIRSVRSVRRWLGKDGNRDVVRLGMETLAFFIGLLTFVIGILVLKSYWTANALTTRALELNEKQIMGSHVPWLGIGGLNFDIPHSRFTYELLNPSDSPAFHVYGQIEYISKDPKSFNIIMQQDGEIKPEFFPPHQTPITQTNAFASSDICAKVREAFRNGMVAITVTVYYKDVFGRQFSMIEKLGVKNTNSDDVDILSTEIRGIEQLR